MTRFTVATFARYAEVMGATTLQVDVAEPATVADLILALRSLPGGALLPVDPLVAVNLRQAIGTTAIAPSDELALLPPLAGG
jgi:molybdopterin converting factor small subunit